jgi:hypothetical protein
VCSSIQAILNSAGVSLSQAVHPSYNAWPGGKSLFAPGDGSLHRIQDRSALFAGFTPRGVRRLLENYRNDPESIEHRVASGKRRKTPAGCSGKGQAVLCVQTAKKRPFSLTQNQPPKTGKVAA